jgi:glycosyltransferase involved in cell wall biosynthesis
MHVDVVMPVRNAASFVPAAIEGLQRQTEAQWRLFVLDHRSTDDTAAVVARIAATDRRVNLIDGTPYESLSDIRNAGLDFADSEFVMLQDADDVSRPDRIANSLRGFDRHPDVVAIGGQADVVDRNGIHLGHWDRPLDPGRISASTLFCNPFLQPTSMLRRSGGQRLRYGVDILGTVFKGDEKVFETFVEDYFLFSQLALIGKVANIPETVIDYRVHGGNTSAVNRIRQIEMAVAVSRSLVRALVAQHGGNYADPAALCNHNGQLFVIPKDLDVDRLYDELAGLIRRAFGSSEGVERELAYRKSIVRRETVTLLLNHWRFRRHHQPDMDEAVAVREWVVGPWRGRPRLTMPSRGASDTRAIK